MGVFRKVWWSLGRYGVPWRGVVVFRKVWWSLERCGGLLEGVAAFREDGGL